MLFLHLFLKKKITISLHKKADVNIRVTIDCDVIQQNGKEYVNIKTVHPKLHVSHLSQHIKYVDVGRFISHIANGIFDANWEKLLETINSDLEIHIGNIVQLILTPIFDEVAIDEFTYKKSGLETTLFEWISHNPSSSSSSSSSSVVQKLAFGLFAWSLLLTARIFQ